MAVRTKGAPEGSKRGGTTDPLARLLADTYTLYVKTQGYHWNVTGSDFPTLHAMFEQQYVELRDAADVIAERIRTLGEVAPGSLGEFASLASVQDERAAPEAAEMIRRLTRAHETTVQTARAAFHAAEEAGDIGTVNLTSARIEAHEKTIWMLKATAS
ncbi:MAG TPA: DNA starvation/stationary phase protection protein [Candidatus Limnocylindrales bacterium]|nr:DNA starvation/stationary phase protection protein [Candidatus Limnocylindrales bacterium]